MRILWFTNTPSKASAAFGYNSPGGGWISSLETLISKEKTYDLGICFFYTGKEYKKLILEDVIYYAIPLKKRNGIQRILSRQMALLNDEAPDYFDNVINDFKPDVIHVFGTELGYGKILINKFDKVIFHMQGLVKPYTEVYFPSGITKKNVIQYSTIGSIIQGLTFFHGHLDLKKRSNRELTIIKHWKYFSGRTHWDRNYVKLLNPTSTYFHCDELLREEFFLHEWSTPKDHPMNGTIVIGSTINPSIYKGLDLIYKVIPLLKDYQVHWKIFGLAEDNILNTVIKKVINNGKKNSSIQFFGAVCATDLITELKKCHFFVHPSYIDNSPNSVCEAQLLGMPVLSSSVGGVSTLVSNSINGFLFNPYDKYDLAGLLAYLINNYSIALKAAHKARIDAIKRHSSDEILKSVRFMYNSIYDA